MLRLLAFVGLQSCWIALGRSSRGALISNYSVVSVEPAATGIFTSHLVKKLQRFGRVAHLDYVFEYNNETTGVECEDLRYKLWMVMHIPKIKKVKTNLNDSSLGLN